MFLDVGPLVFRPARESDCEPLIAVLIDPDVMKWALDKRPLTRGEAETFIGSEFAVGDEVLGMHSISVDSTSEAIGFSGYRRCVILGVDDVEFESSRRAIRVAVMRRRLVTHPYVMHWTCVKDFRTMCEWREIVRERSSISHGFGHGVTRPFGPSKH